MARYWTQTTIGRRSSEGNARNYRTEYETGKFITSPFSCRHFLAFSWFVFMRAKFVSSSVDNLHALRLLVTMLVAAFALVDIL